MKSSLEQAGPFLGIGGMSVAAFLYGYVAIAMPSWTMSVLLPLLWLVLFVLACVWFTRFPIRVIALPMLAIAVWFAVMSARG